MIKNILKKVAVFSERKPFLMVAIILTITVFAGMWATNVKFQTSFEKMLPQDHPVIATLYEVRNNFGDTDVISICIKLKSSDSSDKVDDIRDPRVLRYVKILEADLKEIDGITEVHSPINTIISNNNGTIPNDIETVKEIYNTIPEDMRNGIFNHDYSMIVINAYTDIGGDQKKLISLVDDIQKTIEDSPIPPGVEVVCTSTPPMRKLMNELMKKSQMVTTLVGGIGVLIVLFLYFRKPLSTIMPLIPIVIAVIWTGGAMGILGIPVDMATAGIGSIILGIGIDYSIHLMHRYEEERKKGRGVIESIETAVVSTGMAVMTTTATTVVGFLALIISPLPMMANLGKVCALGITFCMICVITLLPALIVIEEKYVLPFLKIRSYG